MTALPLLTCAVLHRFHVPEVLFQPSLIGLETDGIHTATYNAINKCAADVHPTLYKNVVLAGGNTCFPGIADRMQRELTALAPAETQVRTSLHPQHSGQ